MLTMIDSYAKRKGCAQLDDFETPKGYIRMIAHAIDGRYGDPKACLSTVVQYWKNTMASLSQAGRPVRSDIVLSTTNVSGLRHSSLARRRNLHVLIVHQRPAPEGDEPGSSEACEEVRHYDPLRLSQYTALEVRLASIRQPQGPSRSVGRHYAQRLHLCSSRRVHQVHCS